MWLEFGSIYVESVFESVMVVRDRGGGLKEKGRGGKISCLLTFWAQRNQLSLKNGLD